MQKTILFPLMGILLIGVSSIAQASGTMVTVTDNSTGQTYQAELIGMRQTGCTDTDGFNPTIRGTTHIGYPDGPPGRTFHDWHIMLDAFTQRNTEFACGGGEPNQVLVNNIADPTKAYVFHYVFTLP